MKARVLLLLPTLLLLSFSGKVPTTVDILKAIENNYIQYSISGKRSGTHYTKAFTMDIQNISARDWKVQVPNGLVLTANDSDYQNFIITQEEFISLAPGESKKIPLYAMCIEADDLGPDENQYYEVSRLANSDLLKLTQFIQDNKMFQPEAQYAVWCMTDDRPIRGIAGYDTTAQRQLRNLVAEITGKSLPVPMNDENDYLVDYYDGPMRLTIGGMFEYKFSKVKSVTIAMFDTDNIVVRELFRDPQVKPGYHKFDYEFDASVYTDDVYFIKLIVDDEVKLNLKLDKI
jgi:hypothetical protein